MNIFILEDDAFRLSFMKKHLKEALSNAEIYSTDNVEEAKMILSLGPVSNTSFNIICLDHDLGGKAFVDSNDENTGFQLAKYIKENHVDYKLCIIHSLNFPGAMRMMSEIKNSFYLPVIMWTKESLEYLFKTSII